MDTVQIPSMQLTIKVSESEETTTHRNKSNELTMDCDSFGESNKMKITTENQDSLNRPTSAPCEVTKVFDSNDASHGGNGTIPDNVISSVSVQGLDVSKSDDSNEVKCIQDDNSDVGISSHSSDDDTASSTSYLSTNGLKWTEKKTSRVGSDYQANCIPEAGSYLNLDGDDFDQLELLLLADKIWDPEKAIENGLNDFVHLKCPSNKKEAALELLHQKDYYDPLSSDEIQSLPVLDGTDWSLSEHENFRRLMQETRHNVTSVSKVIGKSINNCLTVYYKIINVRETRSSKSKFCGRKPMDEINQLKDIGRSLRVEKRNERKRSSSETYETLNSASSSEKKNDRKRSSSETKEATGSVTSTMIQPTTKRRKAAVTSNKIKTKEMPTRMTRSSVSKAKLEEPHMEEKKSIPESKSKNEKDLATTLSRTGRAPRAAKERAIISIVSMSLPLLSSTSVSNPTQPSKSSSDYVDHNDDNSQKITRKMTKTTKNRPKTNTVSAPVNYSYLNLKSEEKNKQSRWKSHRQKNNNSRDKDGEIAPEDLWDYRFAELLEFKEKYGHCLVPKVYPENRKLSYWVFRQRGIYAKNKSSLGALARERYQRLKDIDFVFHAKNSDEQMRVEAARRKPQLDAKWNSFYEEFCKFKEETGSCLIPKMFEENQALSSWAFTQRHQMKRRKDGKYNLLTDERIKKLNDIGFIWHAKSNKEWQEAERVRKQGSGDIMWQKHYKSLLGFKKKHGHTRVPKIYKTNQALSTWVFRQRAQYRLRSEGETTALSDDRLDLLEKIGFQFRVRK